MTRALLKSLFDNTMAKIAIAFWINRLYRSLTTTDAIATAIDSSKEIRAIVSC